MAELSDTIDLVPLYDDVDRLAALYRDELMRCGAVATGNLVKFNTDITYDGRVIHVYFMLPQYWGAIEEGRRPTVKSEGGVLYPAIRRWLDVKSINPVGMSRDTLAHLITRKIHKLGFFGKDHHGKHPLGTAMTIAMQQGLTSELATSVADQFGKQIQVDLKGLNDRPAVK